MNDQMRIADWRIADGRTLEIRNVLVLSGTLTYRKIPNAVVTAKPLIRVLPALISQGTIKSR